LAATQSMTKDDVSKMFEGQYEYKDFPSWTKTVDQINEQVGRYLARMLPAITVWCSLYVVVWGEG